MRAKISVVRNPRAVLTTLSPKLPMAPRAMGPRKSLRQYFLVKCLWCRPGSKVPYFTPWTIFATTSSQWRDYIAPRAEAASRPLHPGRNHDRFEPVSKHFIKVIVVFWAIAHLHAIPAGRSPRDPIGR